MNRPLRLAAMPLLLGLVFLLSCPGADPPFHLYLTWQGDTSSTMTVNFHTRLETDESVVYYDTVPRGGAPASYAHSARGSAHRIPELADGRFVHSVLLTGLEGGTAYYFVAGAGRGGFTEERSFQTMPMGREPIRFVTGGDMKATPLTRMLLTRAAENDPQFAIIGGDLAYANGVLGNFGLWDHWLSNWEELMVTSEGHTIPMVLAIGNHETRGGLLRPADEAPFYFGYFPQEADSSYFSRSFGENLVFFVLDSGHVAPHGGAQAAWLEQEMAIFEDVPYKFAIYHIPLYPSHRDFLGPGSVLGRLNWRPIFDEYGLTAAFENHDHAHKRTFPLKDNQIDLTGTIYLGDGCFGVAPRTVDDERRWYEIAASSTPHFWLVDVTSTGVTYSAIDRYGEVFDGTRTF